MHIHSCMSDIYIISISIDMYLNVWSGNIGSHHTVYREGGISTCSKIVVAGFNAVCHKVRYLHTSQNSSVCARGHCVRMEVRV